MKRHRHLVAVTALATVLAPAAVAAAPASATPRPAPPPKVAWAACPTYSDDVLTALGLRGTAAERFRTHWARTDCGTVSVPLGYATPKGRTITVAITRLPATDRKHRLGSLALNPGGPGGGGYLLPMQFMFLDGTAKLNERYDLIGFDPRGVGYSSTLECQLDGQTPPALPVTERAARKAYAATVATNQACAAKDPAFLGQLTTGNVARDLDRVRAALGERKLHYYGVSWGSWLGPVYRSLFPDKAGRIWVDSVAPPDPRMDAFDEMRAMATERGFTRMAAWMARFDSTYGFGRTRAAVEASLRAMREDFEAHPRVFSDVPFPIGGFEIALLAGVPSVDWPEFAAALADLRHATGPTAPESLKRLIGSPPEEPPPGMPSLFSPTAGLAILCNGDGGARSFSSAWNAYQSRLRRFPMTATTSAFVPLCAGWPLPVERIRLHHGGGPLVLSGHRWESVSVYEWTADMHAAVGGTVFTVEDDMHGSLLELPKCVARVVRFFNTGTVGARGCEGIPVPSGPELQPDSAESLPLVLDLRDLHRADPFS